MKGGLRPLTKIIDSIGKKKKGKKKTFAELCIEFRNKISQEPDPRGCWNWIGRRPHGRYGVIQFHGEPWIAHRVAYFIATLKDPYPLLVLHKCDNPACVNPGHFFLGTNLDNNRDRASKGRTVSPHGETHNKSKLTEADVIEICWRINDRGIQYGFESEWAREFGVSRTAIQGIRHKRSWKYITEEMLK